MGRVVNATSWLLYPQERDLVPMVQGAVWPPGQGWTGAEHLAPTGIRSLDHPARRKLLYYSSVVVIHIVIRNSSNSSIAVFTIR